MKRWRVCTAGNPTSLSHQYDSLIEALIWVISQQEGVNSYKQFCKDHSASISAKYLTDFLWEIRDMYHDRVVWTEEA